MGGVRYVAGLLAWIAIAGLSSGLVGCGTLGSYALEGKVVPGGMGMIGFVDEDDEQLRESGVGQATINVYRDGGKPNQRLVATGRSDRTGWVEISLDAFGAGWMEERWLIEVTRVGYETSGALVELPGKREGKRLLVVLMPGVSLPAEGRREDLWGEYERFK